MASKSSKGQAALGQIQLTRHFYLEEFVASDTAARHGIDNRPNAPTIVQNLFKCAELLEQVRSACGNKAVFITSGYRSPEVNRLIGGSKMSAHMTGAAVDFKVPGYGSPVHVAHRIVDSGVKFGQLIYEGNWVHISLPDSEHDSQVLTAVFRPGEHVRYLLGLPELPGA